MTDICVLPDFNTDQTSEIITNLFGLKGHLKPLNGERDLNYLLETESGRFVFKIANKDEPYGMLECQHQVLELLQTNRVLPVHASSHRSINGRAIEIVESSSGEQHYCRLLDYVEGRLLSEVHPHSPILLQNLGKTLATIDQTLRGFSHDALSRPLLWNMIDALDTLEKFKPLLRSQGHRNTVEHFEKRFHKTLSELKQHLRVGVIHNDANDNNVLVDDQVTPQRVTSIIDFGDMVYSWIAAEPAIASAYVMLGKNDPIESALNIVGAYHQQYPLNHAEVEILFDLICMRLCMSVSICAYQRSIDPDNEYLGISEQPAWALLQKLQLMNHQKIVKSFHQTCPNSSQLDSSG